MYLAKPCRPPWLPGSRNAHALAGDRVDGEWRGQLAAVAKANGFIERVMEPSVALQRTETSGGLQLPPVASGAKGPAARAYRARVPMVPEHARGAVSWWPHG